MKVINNPILFTKKKSTLLLNLDWFHCEHWEGDVRYFEKEERDKGDPSHDTSFNVKMRVIFTGWYN